MKILVTDKLADEAINLLKEKGFEIGKSRYYNEEWGMGKETA